jgi:hypothetical protein
MMEHQEQAQQLQTKQQETRQARQNLDTREQPAAAPRRSESEQARGMDRELAFVKDEKKKDIASRGPALQKSDSEDLGYFGRELASPQPGRGSGKGNVSQAGSGVAETLIEELKEKEKPKRKLKDILREQLARKKAAGKQLSALEEALLNGEVGLEELAATRGETPAELEKKLEEAFRMDGSETDAFVQAMIDDFFQKTQGALLGAESEMLFQRVHKAHQRFALREK